MAEIVKVKRDGPRGWHWIAADKFDPEVHELYSEGGDPIVAAEAPKRRGRAKA